MRLDTPAIIRIARENGAVSVAEPLNLGARVRELRKERGWTLEQAAGHAGLARSTLSKIENGQMSPTYEALKKTGRRAGHLGAAAFYPPLIKPSTGALDCHKSLRGQAHATTTYEHELLAAQLFQPNKCCHIAPLCVPAR